MASKLAVVIVNWRNEDRTLRCVSMVRDWRGLAPSIYVVDNEATPKSRARLAAALDSTELICSQANRGYGGGNNLGIERARQAGADYLLLLNSDAEIDEVDVSRLLDKMETNPDLAILGPVLRERHSDGSVQCLMGGTNIAQGALTRIAANPEMLRQQPGFPLKDVDYVPGAVLLARTSLFARIGLLDEQFFFSGEIADLCKRAADSGQRVCVDLESEARHDTRQTPGRLRATLYVYYSLRNRRLFAIKHYPSESTKYLATWSKLCLVEFARALAHGNLRKARAIALAFVHGCNNRFGDQNAAFL